MEDRSTILCQGDFMLGKDFVNCERDFYYETYLKNITISLLDLKNLLAKTGI